MCFKPRILDKINTNRYVKYKYIIKAIFSKLYYKLAMPPWFCRIIIIIFLILILILII